MKYRNSFNFDTRDIDLIEQALRQHMTTLTPAGDADVTPARSRELQNLLGKIHNQKIFYSQAYPGSTPNG